MRDPARTEDVEEALEALKRLERNAYDEEPLMTASGASARANTVRSLIGDLRSRLEEVAEENEHLRELVANESEGAATFRRRADRLEEAARDAGVAMYYEGVESERERSILSRSDAKQLAGDAVAAALDSREDEGVEVHLRADENLPEETARALHDAVQELSRQPVHADEPEGDEQWECPVCYTVVSGKGTNDRVFVCPNADCPQTTVSKADTFRYQPTDEPVSGEGERVECHEQDCDEYVRLVNRVHILEQENREMAAKLGLHPEKHTLGQIRNISVLDPPTHADARSGADGEFGDPPRPGESKKQFAERVLDEAQEAPLWDVYVYSLACGLYDAEKQTYPEPSMESDGTALTDRHEDEQRDDG